MMLLGSSVLNACGSETKKPDAGAALRTSQQKTQLVAPAVSADNPVPAAASDWFCNARVRPAVSWRPDPLGQLWIGGR
jgi:hypothetical protein